MMKVVYIAGPFRADSAWQIENNVRRAEELSYHVWAAGAAAFCPHTNTRYFHGSLPDDAFIQGTLAMLGKCDAMLVVPDYLHSEGTKGEIEFAQLNHIPVFYGLDELEFWLSKFRVL